MKYPARFKPDPEAGGYVVTFRDIPAAITQGDDDAEAMEMAKDDRIVSMLEMQKHEDLMASVEPTWRPSQIDEISISRKPQKPSSNGDAP
ncbi:type II toxin-antitoxin system HicB family antitoxin [Massilia sp. erpn]|uniref:type II toxin-antitoxin system HicB family antitoxin n=1 Tax=Massilia sp. erpn TaxID=2738142 RepID=UPI00272C31C3|nr:type II toxin-antitoxin system HicB family antitoxin [Massilia sp. erpn]